MKVKFISFVLNLIKRVAVLLPLKNYIIFESNPDFADNTFEVYQKMLELELNNQYKFFWFLNGTNEYELPNNVYIIKRKYGSTIDRIKTIWINSRAKYIIDCNAYVHKLRKNQVRIHIKHGLPIKDASAYNYKVGKVDALVVPSEKWIDICSEEHKIDKEFIKPLGFPRNDVLIPKVHSQKTIIWMPTYRYMAAHYDNKMDINDSLKFGLPCIKSIDDLVKVNELLVNLNAILYIRFHPVQDIRHIKFEVLSNIRLCNDEFLKNKGLKLYEFLCETDALISDYSSIYYDYQKLNKPIALSINDFDEYASKNGLICKTVEEFKEKFPAIHLNDFEELTQFITDVINEKNELMLPLETAAEMYDMRSVDNSAQRIVDYLIENYDF